MTNRPSRVYRGEPTETPRRRYVSLQAAGEFLDIAPRTLRRYVAQGTLTGYRVVPGGDVRVDMNEVEALIQPIPTVGTIQDPAS